MPEKLTNGACSGGKDTDTATRIARVAMKLFSQHGYDGVSTTDIARASGVSQPAIHYHFSDKKTLWQQSMRELAAVVSTGHPYVDKIFAEEDPYERLKLQCAALVDVNSSRKELGRVILREGIAGGERLEWLVKEVFSPLYGMFLEDVKECMRRGVIKEYEPEKVVVMLHVSLSMFQNLAPLIKAVFDQDPTDPAEAKKYGDMVMKVIFKGLMPD